MHGEWKVKTRAHLAQGSSLHTMEFCLLETEVQSAGRVHRSHRMGAMGELEKVSCLLSCAGRGTRQGTSCS